MTNCRGGIATKFKAEGQCRLCERKASVRPLTRHRIVPGAVGGPYRADNVVPLCRPCHDLVDHRDEDVRVPARRMLRVVLWPVEVAYARRWLRGRFDTMYPPAPRPAAREWTLELRPDAAPALRVSSETKRKSARHLRHCKASAGGCVYGCPVAANAEYLALASR